MFRLVFVELDVRKAEEEFGDVEEEVTGRCAEARFVPKSRSADEERDGDTLRAAFDCR